ncbi:hypothetical protein OAN12_01845 [Halioglobus sp.]|nr:hypothetical protein [Halioglobus sp.]
MALSDAERAQNYRYAARVEKTIDKLWELLSNPPEKYQGQFFLMPNRGEAADALFSCAALIYDSDWRCTETKQGELAIEIILPESLPDGETEASFVESQEKEWDAWDRYKKVASAKPRKSSALKITRNAFCDQVLGAKLTNSRWGWVGVKEGESGEKGALYLFGWEHNKGRDGEGTIGFFHKEVGLDANGRRRPGHRDALEKIERVLAGELKPYIVWQTAEDPTAKRKTIESFNGAFISECELYLDDSGWWTGRIGDPVSLSQVSE